MAVFASGVVEFVLFLSLHVCTKVEDDGFASSKHTLCACLSTICGLRWLRIQHKSSMSLPLGSEGEHRVGCVGHNQVRALLLLQPVCHQSFFHGEPVIGVVCWVNFEVTVLGEDIVG